MHPIIGDLPAAEAARPLSDAHRATAQRPCRVRYFSA